MFCHLQPAIANYERPLKEGTATVATKVIGGGGATRFFTEMLRAAPGKDEIVVICCNAMQILAHHEKRVDRTVRLDRTMDRLLQLAAHPSTSSLSGKKIGNKRAILDLMHEYVPWRCCGCNGS